MKPLIYLDMDGVCCDFNKAALETFDRMDLYDNKHYSVRELIGITDKEFWEKISKKEEKFWSGLEEFSWFKEMYEGLNKIGDVYFCTAPTLDPNCVKGKLIWLQNRFGFGFKKYIFMKDKHLLAKPDNFLVDDFEEQFENFKKNEGNAVLFPQPWNANRDIENRVEFVLTAIKNRIEK